MTEVPLDKVRAAKIVISSHRCSVFSVECTSPWPLHLLEEWLQFILKMGHSWGDLCLNHYIMQETLFIVPLVSFFFFFAVYLLYFFFVGECKYFLSVNVTLAVLISLPFCLHLQNRPSCCFCFVWDAEKKRGAQKEQSKRQVPVCVRVCVCASMCVCVCAQHRKWHRAEDRKKLKSHSKGRQALLTSTDSTDRWGWKWS